jgi:hypothetical protein
MKFLAIFISLKFLISFLSCRELETFDYSFPICSEVYERAVLDIMTDEITGDAFLIEFLTIKLKAKLL